MSRRGRRTEQGFGSEVALDFGPWCKSCRRRQSWLKLNVEYETRSGDQWRVWFCPRCGAMLREDDLTDMGMAMELERPPTPAVPTKLAAPRVLDFRHVD